MQILRIFAALAIIFAAGLLTGRWTAPRSPVSMAGPGGKVVTSDMVLARLTAEIGLDAGQKAKAQDVIEDVSEQMAAVPPASTERRDLFRKCVPRIRALLRPDQLGPFDRYVEQAEKHFARLIRRREALQANPDLPPPRTGRRPAQ